MNTLLTASGSKRAASFRLAACALICLAAAPAVARQCPRGQYLRVSKGICVDKADARKKLGNDYHGVGSGGGRDTGAGAPSVIHSEASTAYATGDGPDSGMEDVVKARSKKPAAPLAADAPHSPYGELSLDSFDKPH